MASSPKRQPATLRQSDAADSGTDTTPRATRSRSPKVPEPNSAGTPGRRLVAASLVAQDELTDEAIAASLGMSRRTLTKWKARPEFAAEVERIRAKCRAVVEAHALGTVAGRMSEYQHRHELMKQVIADRAVAGGNAPGAKTGLLVKTYKIVGGQESYPVEEWQVDTGLLKELRELEKQVSIEQGQWAEKKEVSGNISITIAGVDVEKL